MRYVTPEDWQAFHQHFPGASAFLTARDLAGEYRVLTALAQRGHATEWQRARLAELREWAEKTAPAV